MVLQQTAHYLSNFNQSVGHYCNLLTALKILESRKIRFSPLATMNDPWESKKRRFLTFAPTTPHQQKMASEIGTLADAVKSHIKLFCGTHDWTQPEFGPRIPNPWLAPDTYNDPVAVFSSTDFDSRHFNQPRKYKATDASCWSRMRMWDHYGNQRRGACLVFDRDELAKAVHDSFPYSCSGHVFYTSSSQRLSTTNSRVFQPPLCTEDVQDAIRQHINLHIKDLVFLKDQDWSNENEFRAVIYDTSSTSFCDVDYKRALKAIVLGLEIERTLIPAVQEWANDVPVYFTDWDDNFGRMKLGSPCT